MQPALRHLVGIASFVMACLSLCAELSGTPPLTPPPQAPSYRPVFTDDFNSLDLSRDGSGAHTWYEGVWFGPHRELASNISARDSILSLAWRSGQGDADTSISTFSARGSTPHSWRYGYFEARMKWDVVRGAWPAFWLIPVEDAKGLSTYHGIKESGEIDVFEGQGDQPHTFYGTIHDWINGKSTSNEDNHFALPADVDLTRFHVYGMLWTPGRISWYFDNRLLHAEAAPAIVDKQHFFVVLSMQEGVDWKMGDTSGVNRPKMVLDVDWVRVWQKPASK